MSDLIDRQMAIDEIKQYITHLRCIDKHRIKVFNAMELDIESILKQLPLAEPQERTGYWIYDGFDHPHGIEWCHCSRCGNQENVKSVYTQIDKYPYCAKCGAHMIEEDETDG